MLVAAAVLPHPPLIVPAVAAGAAIELDALRVACTEAVASVMEASPEALFIVGGAAKTATYEPGTSGSLLPFGVDLRLTLPGRPLPKQMPKQMHWDSDIERSYDLPLSMVVAAYLLAKASVAVPTRGVTVDFHTSSSKAQHLGTDIAESYPRVAMLAMGDGSASLGSKSPGYIAPGAEAWQESVNRAMATADFVTLGQFTEAHSDRYLAAGRAAWQVLVGAATSQQSQWSSSLHYAAAPYGVQYIAASFRRVDGGVRA